MHAKHTIAFITWVSSCAWAQTPEAVLPAVVIQPTPAPLASALLPSGLGRVTVIDLDRAPATALHLDQLLIDQGVAAYDASNSLGIANGLSVRGFAATSQGSSSLQVGRNFLNGHADLVWRFARDPATLSRVELVSGSDATLLGAGSPAATVLYTSKTPEGAEFRKLGLALGSNGLKRLVGDAEWHFGPLQSRAVLALQRGERSVEGVRDERSVVLLSNKLPLGQGTLRLDLEQHHNTTPFPFGTAYAGGKFWVDQPYVDPRASANRQYRRQALYADHPVGEAVQASAYWQRGHSTRSETLLGFFDPKNATQLRGYYRTIEEDNHQSDFGLKVKGQLRTGELAHDWAAVWQHLGLGRSFAGPQNIAGFTLDLDHPVFPTDLSTLPLAPRFAFERYQERGVALADVMRLGEWEARLGLRRSSYQLASSTSPTVAIAPVADAAHTSSSLGVGKKVSQTQRLWLSRSDSFLPNRGRFTGGAFLPPSVSSQWELGWQYQQDKQNYSLALFDLRQSNLPAKDPTDPDALVLIGSNRSKGWEAKADFATGPVRWQAALTRLHARVQDRVSPTQGGFLTGTPDGYGSLRASLPVAISLQTWARLQGATSRPGDDKASFRAPGYGVLSAGLESTPSQQGLRWGASVQNLADRRYVRALTGADNVWQGPTRSVQVWVESAL
jgi:outer membrane receptor protein involved in Fe transport